MTDNPDSLLIQIYETFLRLSRSISTFFSFCIVLAHRVIFVGQDRRRHLETCKRFTDTASLCCLCQVKVSPWWKRILLAAVGDRCTMKLQLCFDLCVCLRQLQRHPESCCFTEPDVFLLISHAYPRVSLGRRRSITSCLPSGYLYKRAVPCIYHAFMRRKQCPLSII